MNSRTNPFNRYQLDALRTANLEQPFQQRVLVAGLGLVDESLEVLELYFEDVEENPDNARFIKEAGDVMWYTAEILSCFNTFMGTVWRPREIDLEIKDLNFLAQALCLQAKNVGEFLKKWAGHGHTMDLDSVKINLMHMMHTIEEMCLLQGTSLQEVMDANIAKLKARYPVKFSAELSINRVE